MKKRSSSIHTIGIPSIFLIFAVLCMVILSLLALGASRSDLYTSKKAMEQTTAYYEAGNQACTYWQETELLLEKLCIQAADETAYWESVSQHFSQEKLSEKDSAVYSYDAVSRLLTIRTPVSPTQELVTEGDVLWPQDSESPCLNIRTWKTRASDNWNPDLSLLIKGE